MSDDDENEEEEEVLSGTKFRRNNNSHRVARQQQRRRGPALVDTDDDDDDGADDNDADDGASAAAVVVAALASTDDGSTTTPVDTTTTTTTVVAAGKHSSSSGCIPREFLKENLRTAINDLAKTMKEYGNNDDNDDDDNRTMKIDIDIDSLNDDEQLSTLDDITKMIRLRGWHIVDPGPIITYLTTTSTSSSSSSSSAAAAVASTPPNTDNVTLECQFLIAVVACQTLWEGNNPRDTTKDQPMDRKGPQKLFVPQKGDDDKGNTIANLVTNRWPTILLEDLQMSSSPLDDETDNNKMDDDVRIAIIQSSLTFIRQAFVIDNEKKLGKLKSMQGMDWIDFTNRVRTWAVSTKGMDHVADAAKQTLDHLYTITSPTTTTKTTTKDEGNSTIQSELAAVTTDSTTPTTAEADATGEAPTSSRSSPIVVDSLSEAADRAKEERRRQMKSRLGRGLMALQATPVGSISSSSSYPTDECSRRHGNNPRGQYESSVPTGRTTIPVTSSWDKTIPSTDEATNNNWGQPHHDPLHGGEMITTSSSYPIEDDHRRGIDVQRDAPVPPGSSRDNGIASSPEGIATNNWQDDAKAAFNRRDVPRMDGWALSSLSSNAQGQIVGNIPQSDSVTPPPHEGERYRSQELESDRGWPPQHDQTTSDAGRYESDGPASNGTFGTGDQYDVPPSYTNDRPPPRLRPDHPVDVNDHRGSSMTDFGGRSNTAGHRYPPAVTDIGTTEPGISVRGPLSVLNNRSEDGVRAGYPDGPSNRTRYSDDYGDGGTDKRPWGDDSAQSSSQRSDSNGFRNFKRSRRDDRQQPPPKRGGKGGGGGGGGGKVLRDSGFNKGRGRGRGRGRGLEMTQPAWMTKQQNQLEGQPIGGFPGHGVPSTQMQSDGRGLQSGASEQGYSESDQYADADPNSDYQPPQVGSGRGRGRGREMTQPAWMTKQQNQSERPPVGGFPINDAPSIQMQSNWRGLQSGTSDQGYRESDQFADANPNSDYQPPQVGSGRGRHQTKPAWMTRQEGPNGLGGGGGGASTAADPSLSLTAAVPSDEGAGRGRGRGRTLPAWMTAQGQQAT